MKQNVTPICKKDTIRMGKAGFTWSGKNKLQRWRCGKCGSTTIKDINGKSHEYPFDGDI